MKSIKQPLLIVTFIALTSIAFGLMNAYQVNKGIEIGKKQILDVFAKAIQKQINKQEIENAKKIDQSIGSMSSDNVRDSLRSDFRGDDKNRQDSNLQTVAKDKAEQAGHGRDVKADISKQPETSELLPKENCYPVKTETTNETILVCDDE